MPSRACLAAALACALIAPPARAGWSEWFGAKRAPPPSPSPTNAPSATAALPTTPEGALYEEVLRALSQRSFSFVEECLRDAQAEGSVNPALPTGPGAIAVLGAIHTAAALQVMQPDSAQAAPEAVWQAMKTLLVSEPGSATRRS